jgi:hypothetical protein
MPLRDLLPQMALVENLDIATCNYSFPLLFLFFVSNQIVLTMISHFDWQKIQIELHGIIQFISFSGCLLIVDDFTLFSRIRTNCRAVLFFYKKEGETKKLKSKSLYRSRAGNHFYGIEYEIWADFGPTLCRNKVWIGMKVLQANSIILGTRKLWRIFPI